MPMGIVSDSDFESEIGRLTPPSKKEHNGTVTRIERGRPEGTPNVPDSLRRIIGDESETNGRQAAVELAQQFGLSASSVSAYAVGATSTATYNDRPNHDVISNARGRIKLKAVKTLRSALKHITPDKLEMTKARDLAGIAKDMSAIVRNMEEGEAPTRNPNDPQKPVFLVYAPTVKEENHYQTVIAKD